VATPSLPASRPTGSVYVPPVDDAPGHVAGPPGLSTVREPVSAYGSTTALRHFGNRLRAYLNLAKPHVTMLLLVVTVMSMIVARAELPDLRILVPVLVGGFLAAASANAINCYVDRDIDSIMGRTQRRSIPAGRVTPLHSLVFGLVCGVASFIVLFSLVNGLSALLALSGILFYVGVYTLALKRNTPQNIVIGGAAGAVPVLVGWAATTDTIAWPAVAMFAIIFLWTPPHFWALSLILKKDYERAGIPMLPVVRGDRHTQDQILIYTVVLVPVTLALFLGRDLGIVYLVTAGALGIGLMYIAAALRFAEAGTAIAARWANRMFWYSNLYLAILFLLMAVDKLSGI
jgi:protoheme IX farnesyltransferase